VYDPTDRRREWANSSGNGIDLRHQGRISWRYALPFASLASNSVVKQIVGGWELAGITVLQSGVPFGAGCSGDPTNTGGGCRADVVPGVSWKVENQSYNLWFNPAAFKIPTSYNWGNSGRNFMRGPALYNFDYTLSRRFNLSEQRYIAFRWEAFNAFNTPQLQPPAATIGNVGVGSFSATTRANRQMQLALRLVF
jgi:hypothetical protein